MQSPRPGTFAQVDGTDMLLITPHADSMCDCSWLGQCIFAGTVCLSMMAAIEADSGNMSDQRARTTVQSFVFSVASSTAAVLVVLLIGTFAQGTSRIGTALTM